MQLLLESGALCERDTFQGERCLYNALNDRIRTLLLSYDYSKSTDPLQPFAAHVTALLTREHPSTWDIEINAGHRTFHLHKILLSARSPYFRKKLTQSPSNKSWTLPASIPPPSFDVAARYLYLDELPKDLGGGLGTGYTEEEVLQGLDKVTKHLEIQSLWDDVLESGDRRLARQRRTDELARAREQIEDWFRGNVLKHKISVETSRVNEVKWDRDNGVFADALLRADFPLLDEGTDLVNQNNGHEPTPLLHNGIPIGPSTSVSRPTPSKTKPQQSILFPVHRAILTRSEYFHTMFSSSFLEAQESHFLHIIHIDCTPDVLEVVLTYLYCEKADFGLDIALDVLFTAEMLLIEKLKTRAATLISTLGNGAMSQLPQPKRIVEGETAQSDNDEPLDIYEIVRAAWLLRIPRLEEFAARYFAYRLENHIDEEDFAELIKESAERIQKRQETDSIELLDDIRFYLSERFRLRFEDMDLEEVMEEDGGVGNGGVGNGDSEVAEAATKAESKADSPPHPAEQTNGADYHNKGNSTISISNPASSLRAAAPPTNDNIPEGTVIRTLDGEIAGDEFASDALNYQILLGKIDGLLERLKLDA